MTWQIRHARAFTLIEMLAALAVMGLLVLIMFQIISLTERAIDTDSKNLNAAAQARLIFDRIGNDWIARPLRSDIGVSFTKRTGSGVSDSFRFYSQVDSYNNVRGITAVGYRIQTSTPGRIYQIERGAVGMDWSAMSTGLQFLPQSLTAADLDAADDADYDVLASGVFRLEFCYLLKNGTLTIVSQSDFTTVAAVVVAIGVVDTNSLKLLASNPGAQLSSLSGALDKTTEGNDPLALWNADIAAGLVAPGVPKPVLQNVHVYERSFSVQ